MGSTIRIFYPVSLGLYFFLNLLHFRFGSDEIVADLSVLLVNICQFLIGCVKVVLLFYFLLFQRNHLFHQLACVAICPLSSLVASLICLVFALDVICSLFNITLNHINKFLAFL